MAITLFARPLQLCGRRRTRNRRTPNIIPCLKQAIQSLPAAAAVVFLLPTVLGTNVRPNSRVLRYDLVNEIRNEKVAKACTVLFQCSRQTCYFIGKCSDWYPRALLTIVVLLKFNISKLLAELKLQNCVLVSIF